MHTFKTALTLCKRLFDSLSLSLSMSLCVSLSLSPLWISPWLWNASHWAWKGIQEKIGKPLSHTDRYVPTALAVKFGPLYIYILDIDILYKLIASLGEYNLCFRQQSQRKNPSERFYNCYTLRRMLRLKRHSIIESDHIPVLLYSVLALWVKQTAFHRWPDPSTENGKPWPQATGAKRPQLKWINSWVCKTVKRRIYRFHTPAGSLTLSCVPRYTIYFHMYTTKQSVDKHALTTTDQAQI